MGNYMPTSSGQEGATTPTESGGTPIRFVPNNREALEQARKMRQESKEEQIVIQPAGSGETVEQMRAREIEAIDYTQYEYDFENIVLEGGGAKGIVYVGALQVLEEVGVKPKRFAGASAGAMVAALASIGYTSAEINEVLELDLEDLLLDHSYGYFSLLPNLLRHFGWNPGNRLLDKFGELIQAKTGDPNTTFRQLYQSTGVELCIIAVNVNMMRAEYFHAKTTPDVPIKMAVRMSMSIPAVFQPVPIRTVAETTDYYVDGGVLCNYPIHAFDGWWLSMKMEDTFLNRIQPLSAFSRLVDMNERFGERNDKSLGFIVYSSREQDVMRDQLEKRVGLGIKPEMRPNTKLVRERAKELKGKIEAEGDHEIFMEAMQRFTKKLEEVEGYDGHRDDVTSRDELRKCLEEAVPLEEYDPYATEFSTYDIRILFGDDHSVDEIFDYLDMGHRGRIAYEDLLRFVSRAGVNINTKYQGYDRQSTDKLGQFFTVLTSSWLTNSTKMYLKNDDIQRTVGINCDYLETMDFALEPDDREFAKKQGRRSTIAFLKHHIYKQGDNARRRVQ